MPKKVMLKKQITKSKQIGIRVEPKIIKRFEKIAFKNGMNVSEMVRWMIRREVGA